MNAKYEEYIEFREILEKEERNLATEAKGQSQKLINQPMNKYSLRMHKIPDTVVSTDVEKCQTQVGYLSLVHLKIQKQPSNRAATSK